MDLSSRVVRSKYTPNESMWPDSLFSKRRQVVDVVVEVVGPFGVVEEVEVDFEEGVEGIAVDTEEEGVEVAIIHTINQKGKR